MTTSAPTPAYNAPKGFKKGYTFDKSGNVFADGKQMNGLRLDVNSIKLPEAPQQSGVASIANSVDPKKPAENPFLTNGGTLSRLSADDKGNVYAHIATPNTPALGGGYNGMGGSYNAMSGVQTYGTPTNTGNTKIKLDGITLDKDRMTKSANKPLGEDNNVYLREDQDGLYFAQINQGKDIAAYAYSQYQTASNPVGGPKASATSGRRQGGNAGRGVGVTSNTVSLLGS